MDRDNIWEFAIKIPKKQRWSCIQTLRTKVQPVIEILEKEWDCGWYCFLVHDNRNGVPIKGYDGWQYHVRYEKPDKRLAEFLPETLPDYCLNLRKTKLAEQIRGVDNKLFHKDIIAEYPYIGWDILYLQCNWVMNFLKAHEKLTLRQIRQYLHYFGNIFQCEVK